jgi:cytidine deaminase
MTKTLDARSDKAVRDALVARDRAYAPYSGFRMGAAVVTEHDAIVKGALLENVSLGLAMCAERVALFATLVNQAGRPENLRGVSDGRERAEARVAELAPRLPFEQGPWGRSR